MKVLEIDELSPKAQCAIIAAHNVGRSDNVNGSPARIGNYSIAHIAKKTKFLKKGGFDDEQIRSLMTKGVVGCSTACWVPPCSMLSELQCARRADCSWDGGACSSYDP